RRVHEAGPPPKAFADSLLRKFRDDGCGSSRSGADRAVQEEERACRAPVPTLKHLFTGVLRKTRGHESILGCFGSAGGVGDQSLAPIGAISAVPPRPGWSVFSGPGSRTSTSSFECPRTTSGPARATSAPDRRTSLRSSLPPSNRIP